ncbi:hypothetical protein NPIL_423911 [Nephila pilipes]|uniref:Uncharacterized protein n=1 Tax=Nephila pilipes TaxID=299642 RepID=A0A8X6P7U2_NEPPI|nr:hypothetical protein NPIL_423911 [Nephila pilipes]
MLNIIYVLRATLQRPEFCETFQPAIIHQTQNSTLLWVPLPGSETGIRVSSRSITLSSGNSAHAFIYTHTHLTIHKSKTTAQFVVVAVALRPPPLAFSDRSDLLDIWSATIPCKKS